MAANNTEILTRLKVEIRKQSLLQLIAKLDNDIAQVKDNLQQNPFSKLDSQAITRLLDTCKQSISELCNYQALENLKTDYLEKADKVGENIIQFVNEQRKIRIIAVIEKVKVDFPEFVFEEAKKLGIEAAAECLTEAVNETVKMWNDAIIQVCTKFDNAKHIVDVETNDTLETPSTSGEEANVDTADT